MPMQTEQNYLTHDNGDRPFKVTIQNNIVKIHKYIDYCENSQQVTYQEEPYKTYHPKKIFVGKSLYNAMTSFSGGHGPKFDGNSLLLHLEDNTYIYIGDKIFSFDVYYPITKYVSPVGNNDVPYPYAIDEQNNYYLMTEDIVLTQMSEYYEGDPYDYYYHNRLITKNEGVIPSIEPMGNNFGNIKEWYIGDEQYTLTCYINPEKEYKRLTTPPDFADTMYVIRNIQKEILTKNEYIQLMNNFAQHRGYKPFMNVNIIHKRIW